jgi:hypothetical protein
MTAATITSTARTMNLRTPEPEEPSVVKSFAWLAVLVEGSTFFASDIKTYGLLEYLRAFARLMI